MSKNKNEKILLSLDNAAVRQSAIRYRAGWARMKQAEHVSQTYALLWDELTGMGIDATSANGIAFELAPFVVGEDVGPGQLATILARIDYSWPIDRIKDELHSMVTRSTKEDEDKRQARMRTVHGPSVGARAR